MPEIAQSATVTLVGESMNTLASANDVHDLVARAVVAADQSKVLRYFDPYGTLVLNEVQMRDFLEDWEEARKLVTSEQDQRAWDEIRHLALRVQGSNTEFLAISGD